MIRFTTLMAAVGMLVLSASPLHAGVVNCNSPMADLQDAIDEAEAGATLNVTGDCDDGPYFIRKNLKLQGFGDGASLSAPAVSGETVLSMEGVTVELSRLTIDGSSGTNQCIRHDGSSFAFIVDSTIINCTAGIQITGSSNAFIFRNTIESNSFFGIGVDLSSSATVQENDIIKNQVGLLVSKMSSVVLIFNLIEDNTGPGVLIADQYGFLEMPGPNTIQGNNPDVECQARGIVEPAESQISGTGVDVIAGGCVVLGIGSIF